MHILSFDKRYGALIADTRISSDIFSFDDFPLTLPVPIPGINPNTPEGEGMVCITHDYKQDPGCRMLCIETDDDMRSYKKIAAALEIDFTDTHLITPGSNPIIERYDIWMERWRRESISDTLDFRVNVAKYQSLRNDSILQMYLEKVVKLGFILYDETQTTSVEAMEKEIHRWD
jgi:hypothetical protein